jgi:hypothetical protein
MDGTRELVDAQAIGTLLAVLSGIALLLLAALGLVAKSRGSAGARRGALLAGCGVLLFPLWVVYNRIEDQFGLDSVAALLINLALFAVVGALAGVALRRLWPGEGLNSPQRRGDAES